MDFRSILRGAATLVLPLTLYTGCTGNYPNPIADMHAKSIKQLCDTTAPITINRQVSSKGVLFHGADSLRGPEEELLKRRLTFLEVHSHANYPSFSLEDRDRLKSAGVTRYYFADIASADCVEFNARAKEHPFVLIPLRRLGLPEHLCIAKKINVPPESSYFYYHLYQTSSAPFGQDVHHGLVLADFKTLDPVAEVRGFQYCDQPMCWHGFACWRNEEKQILLGQVAGIPDDRVAPISTIELAAPRPFPEIREARMLLVSSFPAESKGLPQAASGNRNATTNTNATVYVTEAYEAREPKGSFSLVGYSLELIQNGRPLQIRIKTSDSEVENPSTLRVTDNEITFLAAPVRTGFRQLNEMFFRYSRSGNPLSLIRPDFLNFERDPSHKYYFEEASYDDGKLNATVLEARIDEHHDIYVLKRHVFKEERARLSANQSFQGTLRDKAAHRP